MGNKGQVLFIDFNPEIKSTPIPFPADLRLIVSNTCIP